MHAMRYSCTQVCCHNNFILHHCTSLNVHFLWWEYDSGYTEHLTWLDDQEGLSDGVYTELQDCVLVATSSAAPERVSDDSQRRACS